jgi:hypothetical protein
MKNSHTNGEYDQSDCYIICMYVSIDIDIAYKYWTNYVIKNNHKRLSLELQQLE